MKRLFLVLALLACQRVYAGGSQFFVELADPQMGMFAKDRDSLQEQANLAFAVASINRLRPAFVVVCGDLVNRAGDSDEISQYKRVMRQVDADIPVYNVAGNHDVGNQPTEQTLSQYRKNFGRDYYTFTSGDTRGIVLDASLIAAVSVPQESRAQERWLVGELQRARREGVKHLFVFQHIPYFLEHADEPDQYFNIPLAARRRYLDLLQRYRVECVFAGHYHRNASGRDGSIEMITTGAVGVPLGKSQSGLRIVRIEPEVQSRFYDLGAIPHTIDSTANLPPCPACAE